MTAPTLYLLGTGDTAIGTPGPDGQCDMVLGAGGSWTQVAPTGLSNSVFNSSCAYDKDTNVFYLMGNGDGANGAWSYNQKSATFIGLANLPSNCFGQGAAVYLNGVVYCMGGINASDAATAKVFSYAPAGSGTYNTSFTNLPTAVNNPGAVLVGNLVYHGGGDQGDGTGNPIANWYQWNPLTDTRSSLHAMPAALGGFACVNLGNFIYCFGGYGPGSTNYAGTKTVYRYSISADTWTTLGLLPVALSGLQGCVFNGTIWLAGGVTTGFGTFSNHVYTYSVAGDSYTSQTNLLTAAWGSILAPAPFSGISATLFGTEA